MKTQAIIESTYKKLLAEILQNLQKTQQKITRQKVEMSWQVGKLVENHLKENKDESYGNNLILRLEGDTNISHKTLYKMRSFYQTYSRLPKDDPKLNWSHYRVLVGIPSNDERKYLEDLTKKNDWSGDTLQKKVAEIKNNKPQKKKLKKVSTSQKLKFSRGKLFNYRLAKMKGSDEMFVDLGFGIFSKIKTNFTENETVESVKKSEKYSLKKSTANKKEMHTYKAFLDRVVDGDTLHVNLDLGFGVFHKEILRLAKINAAESKTKEGQKAATELKKILKDAPFLIIKTNKTDIYGRYIADIFFTKDSQDPNKVASDGTYLNQLLIDSGVVGIF